MKKVNKNVVARPVNLISGRAHYDNAITELGTQKCWPENFSSIYKSDGVKRQLELIYHGKCAFCNQIPKGSSLQVEHFRPKNGVKNEIHTGYYWLGYEWTNLLYACGNCNSVKNTNFPLFPGIARVNNPTWTAINEFDLNDCLNTSTILKNEEYVLLNPEIDNPEESIFYEIDGKISYLDIRGKISIKNYNLNRDELYLDGRKKLLNNLIKKIAKRFLKFTSGEISEKSLNSEIIDIIVEDLVEPIESNDTFDHFRYIIFKNYDLYILPYFNNIAERNLLDKFLDELKKGLNVKLN